MLGSITMSFRISNGSRNQVWGLQFVVDINFCKSSFVYGLETKCPKVWSKLLPTVVAQRLPQRQPNPCPKCAQSVPKSCPKAAQKLPKAAQSCPKAAQKLPKAAQSCPKTPQKLPKSCPKASQKLPNICPEVA